MLTKIYKIYFNYGFVNLLFRLFTKLIRYLKFIKNTIIHSFFSTYSTKKIEFNKINNIVNSSFKNNINFEDEISELYTNHYFDILGSGWTQVNYQTHARGIDGIIFHNTISFKTDSNGLWLNKIINKKNLKYSQYIWQYISKSYSPIDWQLDFISGYRWSTKIQSNKIQIGNIRGVDVKVPWELSRMQHLPQLAIFYKNTNDDKFRIEFQNQVLDFISTNPPNFGINWVCSMDVGIRSANLLLAYDIFKSKSVIFPNYFSSIFHNSILDHGRFIYNNLEWVNGIRANHYIANITSLISISTYLPETHESNEWLYFAISELIYEFNRQFNEDGTNFESSTYYHKLSLEMVIYSTILILTLNNSRKERLLNYKLKKNKIGFFNQKHKINNLINYSNINLNEILFFNSFYFEKLSKAVNFINTTIKDNYKMPQYGDNDSGYFFKLNPIYKKSSLNEVKKIYLNLNNLNYKRNSNYYIEDYLDCRHILSMYLGFFNDPFLLIKNKDDLFNNNNYLLFYIIAKKNKYNIPNINYLNNYQLIGSSQNFEKHIKSNFLILNNIAKFNLDVENSITLFSYQDFGLYVFKSKNIYLSIKAFDSNKFIHHGHQHYDQFSIELEINNNLIFSDPGSYVYTSLKDHRFKFQNWGSHFPFLKFNNTFNKDEVFEEIKLPKAKIIYFGQSGFHSEFEYENKLVFIIIQFINNQINFYSNLNKKYFKYTGEKDFNIQYSEGYGVIKNFKISKYCD